MTSTLLWALGALSSNLLGALTATTRSNHEQFAASLDSKAVVYYPGSEQFIQASARWSASQTPHYEMIVKVATEEDVQKTILYANENNRPFHTISGGHGTTSLINNVINGVGILMHEMNDITIVDDGSAALLEGGVLNGDLIAYLWSHGKLTMSTGCDCVGYIAPILGGGHGWLQGRYGLAADQLISARIVLANGTAISVCEESNPDLFWAIRGAGHNFGVVTQVKMRIYDREVDQDQWAASGFVFTHDKLEAIFALANEWLESPERPIELTHYGLFALNPDVDPLNPIVMMWIYWQGPAIPSKYTDPLYALSPVAVDESVTELPEVNSHIFANRDGASCAKGLSRALVGLSLRTYSLPALRKVLNIFTALPPEFRTTVMMLEGYAKNRVEEIPGDSSAFPDRDEKVLLSPVLTYPKNASLDATAREIGEKIRNALLEGTDGKLRAYVNYATGVESMEELYGYEPWRLEKLRRLKNEYDPFGKFNFYAPIT
ncbi:FAD-binding domain-containing protein [Cucurbitaria berberidis CBS 394.84]|uniref:FAD-binding domain-containing protein n=1 Tax=Cucurbitaria berberidis CBS 394.84 TaxID=1168544 RepID=A0A9P4GRE8_9PLEO|nr:FAD-binding domain-containing protein [Cucurbitaria berberidis CBS 394.84]KAF1850365.1 FAD-binding domain-containing protein [Cucurbitaria berberidis CBS 394.84]